MRTSVIKATPFLVLLLLTVSLSLRSTTAGTDYDSNAEYSETIEPYDWTDWDMDKDSDRIDDRLETEIPEYEIIDGRVGINVHIDGKPDSEDVKKDRSGRPLRVRITGQATVNGFWKLMVLH